MPHLRYVATCVRGVAYLKLGARKWFSIRKVNRHNTLQTINRRPSTELSETDLPGTMLHGEARRCVRRGPKGHKEYTRNKNIRCPCMFSRFPLPFSFTDLKYVDVGSGLCLCLGRWFLLSLNCWSLKIMLVTAHGYNEQVRSSRRWSAKHNQRRISISARSGWSNHDSTGADTVLSTASDTIGNCTCPLHRSTIK